MKHLFCSLYEVNIDFGDAYKCFDVIRAVNYVARYREAYDENRDLLGPNIRANYEIGANMTLRDFAWAHAEQTNIFRKFQQLLGYVEKRFNRPWRSLVQEVTAHGIAFGLHYDPKVDKDAHAVFVLQDEYRAVFARTSTWSASQPVTHGVPIPRATTAAWEVRPPCAVRIPAAWIIPWKSSGVVSQRTRMTLSPALPRSSAVFASKTIAPATSTNPEPAAARTA